MLSPDKIESYRLRLAGLARRLSGDVAQLESEALRGLGGESGGGLSNAPTHLADLGNAHYQEEVDLLVIENETELLSQCNAALDRIDAGTYGVCQECHQEIPESRLQTFPFASLCVPCSEKLDRAEQR